MTSSPLQAAFDHHCWANERVLDALERLDPAQLAAPVPGTYGSMLDTMRHVVGADEWYLYVLGGQRGELRDEEAMSLAELRSMTREHAATWRGVLAEDRDPDADVRVRQKDGSFTRATVGIRLAQAIHHGTDHRSQICTGLSALGVEPPDIDVWAFGEQAGLVTEEPPEG